MPSLGLPSSHYCDESLLVWLSLRITYSRYFFTMVNCHASLLFAVFYVQISHHFITPTNHPLKNCWRVRLFLGLKTLLGLPQTVHFWSIICLWIPSPLPVYHPTKCQLSPRLYILNNHKPRKPSPSHHVTLVSVVSRYVFPSICYWYFIGFECLVTCEFVSVSLLFYSAKILKCSSQMSFSSPNLSMPLHQDVLRISG